MQEQWEKLARAFSPSTKKRVLCCFFLSLIVLIGSGFFLYPRFLDGKQEYFDIISSAAAYYDIYKTGDIRFVFTITALCLGSFFVFAYLLERFFPATILKATIEETQRSHKKDIVNQIFAVILDGILLYFSLAGLFCLGAFLFSHSFSVLLPKAAQLWAFLLVFSFAFLGLYFRPITATVVPIFSLFLPFLLLRFWRTQVFLSDRQEYISPNYFFQTILALLILVCIFFMGRCLWRKKKQGISVFHVALISAFAAYKMPVGQVLSLDGYHTGEMLIPFQQFFSHHLAFYSEFVSVHGFLALSYGFIHHIFFDNTYASVSQAFSLTDSIYAGLMGIALCLLLENRIALLLAIYILPTWNRFNFFPLVLLILAAPFWRTQKSAWVIVAFVLSLCALLFDHAPGLAILLAVMPWVFLRWLQLDAVKQKIYVALALLVIFLGMAKPLWGAFQFIRENGPGTLIAFGVALAENHTPPSVANYIPVLEPYLRALGELFKYFKLYGWIVAVLGILTIFMYQREKNFQRIFVASLSIIFACSLIPYTMGSATVEGLGRAGSLCVLMLGFALPVLFFMGRSKISGIGLIVLLLAFCLRLAPNLKEFRSPLATAVAAISLPEEAEKSVISGQDYPPNLGVIFADSAQLAAQKEFRRFLLAHLDPARQSFFDLTNQQNNYFIHDLSCPYVYPSHLVSVNEKVQRRVIASLEAHPPQFIWFGPVRAYDFFNFNLRAYRIYKWGFEKNYTNILKSDRGTFSFFAKQENPSKVRLASEMQGLASMILQEDLYHLPAAWGRNWPQLARRFREQQKIKSQQVINGHAKISMETTKLGLQNDFLLLSLDGYKGWVRVNFSDVSGTYASFRFFIEANKEPAQALVPMGADPRWLFSNMLTQVDVELENSDFAAKPLDITFLGLED